MGADFWEFAAAQLHSFFLFFQRKKEEKRERICGCSTTQAHTYTHIFVYIYMYICIYVCLYMYISQRPVCMYVHIYITVPNVLIWGTYIYRGTYIYISQRPHTYIYHSAHRALLRYIHIYISQRPTCWFGAPRPPRAPSRGCMSQCSCSPRYSAFFFCALAMCVCVCVCVCVCGVCMYVCIQCESVQLLVKVSRILSFKSVNIRPFAATVSVHKEN